MYGMAFKLVGMSVAVMLVICSSHDESTCSSHDESTFSLETLPDIVISMKQYVSSGCVFFLRPDIVGKFNIFFLPY
jgi:hypothetical protein